MNWKPWVLVVSSVVLAGVSGFLTSSVFAQGNAEPTKTVTINVATGPQGPPGPEGPPGPKGDPGVPGELVCPASFEVGELIVNHPGGQVTLFTCLKGG